MDEPAAPTPDKRFAALGVLRKAGVGAGLNLIPCVPVLGDAPEQLAEVVRRAADAGANYVLFGGGMTRTLRRAQAHPALHPRRFPA